MRKINLLVLSAMLLGGIVFSVIQIVRADPVVPNPGHSTSEIEGTISWDRLSSFPNACPEGQSVIAIDASRLTCTTTATVGDFVPTIGGTMTGELILNSLLSNNTDNPFYINSRDSLQLRINANGGTGLFKVNNSANSTVFSVDNAGGAIIGGGSSKLTVGTIDPVFNIGGNKYSTYLPSMTGVKEETAGVIQTEEGKYVIDFDELEEGSDLWIFYRVTDFGENWDKLVVSVSGEGPGKVWYIKNIAENQLILYGEGSVSLSYRLTAPRFDWRDWLNVSKDGTVVGLTVGDFVNDKYNQAVGIDTQSLGVASQAKEVLFEEFIQKVGQALASFGIIIGNEIVEVKELFTNIIRTEDIEVKGKIQLRDQATGDIYCIWIEQGEWVKTKGKCGSVVTDVWGN